MTLSDLSSSLHSIVTVVQSINGLNLRYFSG